MRTGEHQPTIIEQGEHLISEDDNFPYLVVEYRDRTYTISAQEIETVDGIRFWEGFIFEGEGAAHYLDVWTPSGDTAWAVIEDTLDSLIAMVDEEEDE